MSENGGQDEAASGDYVSTHETHVGAVVLVGDRAYKLKKPVDLGFVDFRAREDRLATCRREVELNQRLAADVYLGVADVHGPDGQPCDHLVVMRRMPGERSLAALIEAGEPVQDALRDLARLIARFHADGGRSAEISAEGSRDAVRRRWREHLEDLRPFRGELLDDALVGEIETRALEFLDGRDALFDTRISEGRIVDGHADLLADDIFCLDDGPRALDCIEFDDRLRWLDGLDDVSFLAMDLEYRGRADLAARFLGWYREFSGDPAPTVLRHHYIAYRAVVRAKVACLRHTPGQESTAADARAHLELAAAHLRAGAVRLVLVGGLPGTGKSTVSTLLADRLGAAVLCTDRLRKELAGLAPTASAADEPHAGLYSPAHTDRTYRELTDRAARLLSHGQSVVLDASWTREGHRRLAAEVAASTHSGFAALRCSAPAEVAASRLRARRHSTSDADPDVAALLAAETDPWPEADTVPTTGSAEESAAYAVALLDKPQDEPGTSR